MRKPMPERVRDAVDSMLDRLRQPGDGVPCADAAKPPERDKVGRAGPERQAEADPEEALRRARGRALVRHARACDAILEAKREGLTSPNDLRHKLGAARSAFEVVRPHGWQDAEAAYDKDNNLAREAGTGRIDSAVRALHRETEIRLDTQRADDFVERFRKLDRASDRRYAAGDYSGYKAARREMGNMAMSLERDAQMESMFSRSLK